MSLEWNLNYSRCVIDDGEPERHVQEDFDWFAVAFYSANRLENASEAVKTAIAVSDYRYRVVGEIVFLSEKACVIDFGLRAISDADSIPPGCREGDYVTGEVSLDLPLATEIAPEEVFDTLRHKWHVNRIHADMTRYISHPEDPKFHFRDDSRIRYESITSTASVRTSSYVLHCSILA